MKRTVEFTMRAVFEDMPKDEREECAALDGIKPSALPRLRSYEADELAEIFDDLEHEVFADLFGGSGLFVRIARTKVLHPRFADARASLTQGAE